MVTKCKRGYKLKNGSCKPNRIKCICNNIKRETRMRLWSSIAIIVIALLVVIFLPTGIDDAYTSIPLLALLGWKIYLIISAIVLVLFLIFFKRVKAMIKGVFRKC
jgi:hypothetical protein